MSTESNDQNPGSNENPASPETPVAETPAVNPETPVAEEPVAPVLPDAVPEAHVEETHEPVVRNLNEEVIPEAPVAEVQPENKPEPLPFNAKGFVVMEEGQLYGLPIYHIEEGVGIQPELEPTSKQPFVLHVPFVRGSKLPGGEDVEKESGIVHEAIVEMMIHDLRFKHNLVPSDETAAVLVHLTAIADLFEARAERRKREGTQGTMKK
jgi:hypothetical protein